MKKIDATVKKETLYIAALSMILAVLMQSVFLIIGKWNTAVLLGGILGYVTAVGNFFLMGLTVQSAIGKEEKAIKRSMMISQGSRFLMLIAVAAIGYLILKNVPALIATALSYLFPRFAIAARPLFKNF